MKKQDQALKRLFGWAREARANEEFELSPLVRRRVLSVWRQDVAGDLNDSVLGFLRWAVAFLIVIMTISVLFNHDYLNARPSLLVDSSPQTIFHSLASFDIYVP